MTILPLRGAQRILQFYQCRRIDTFQVTMHQFSEFHGNKFSFREERRIASSTNYRSNPGLTQLGVSPDKDPTDKKPGPTALIRPGLTTTQERKTERKKIHRTTRRCFAAPAALPPRLKPTKAGEKQRGKGVGATYMIGCGKRGEGDNEQKETGKQGRKVVVTRQQRRPVHSHKDGSESSINVEVPNGDGWAHQTEVGGWGGKESNETRGGGW